MSSEKRQNLTERIAQLSPERRALLEALLQKEGIPREQLPITRRSSSSPRQLSFAQERLWFLNQLVPGNPFYNIHMVLPLRFEIEAEVLSHCFDEIVKRHEVLRTTFQERDGVPVQVVHPTGNIQITLRDLTRMEEARQEAEVRRLSQIMELKPFDLLRGPLMRAELLRLASDYSLLLITMHHIVTDAWSIDILNRELEELYQAFSKGKSSPLPELPIQYADFAEWQRQFLEGEVLARELDYWKDKLAGAPTTLELPADRPRPAVPTLKGASQAILLSRGLTDELKRVSRRQRVSLFMVLLAAFKVLIYRYTGQRDLVVGTPIANRNRPEIEKLIGFFVNTLVIRTRIDGDLSFRELLAQVRDVALEGFAHQDVPFEKLVEELAPERHLSHTPLFQVMFVHQASLNEEGDNGSRFRFALDLNVSESDEPQYGTAKFDLTWFTEEVGGRLSVTSEYSTDLFDDGRIKRMLGHFETLLQGIAARPDQSISTLPLMGAEELALLDGWNQTASDYPRDKGVHEIFQRQASMTPEAAALVTESEEVSYAELEARSNRLAHYLRRQGVESEARVGICLERSIELVVAMLAVLKAGGVYVPLDPGYPRRRLEMILEDTQVALVLTSSGLAGRLPAAGPPFFELDDRDFESQLLELPGDAPEATSAGLRLAYVMYTSGSTGRPKGVMVEHRAIARLALSNNYAELGPDHTFLLFAPISFDANTFEVWCCLLNGGRLAIAPPAMSSLSDLPKVVGRHGVTTIWLTASLLNQLVEGDLSGFGSLKQLLTGGDVLSPPHISRTQQELSACRLINGYGPTESTTFTACHAIGPEDLEGSPIPIGRPIANTQVYILDRDLERVPIGVAGELCVAGDGLARGYWRRPRQTAEKFIPNPFGGQGSRLYRTGDWARFRADGAIEFLGRMDHQVKVRGFRVEPGEVEAVLARHPGLRQVVVVSQRSGAGDNRLFAYVCARDTEKPPTTSQLRRYLLERVPDHMVPAGFVQMQEFPLTPNGKIDRRKLPSPDGARPALDPAYVAPETRLEQEMTLIWQKLLGLEQVGVRDNFFDLGGHSLLMVRLQRELQQITPRPVSLMELFRYPTITALARHLGREE